MNPDVVAAVRRLGREGILTPAQSGLFGRVAGDELVSVRAELRLLLYGGVLAVMGGLSLACWLTAIVSGRMIAYW